MKLEQTIDIKEVAINLKNILSSKGIIYKHYENKFKKKSYCEDFDKAYYKLRIIKPKKGKSGYVRSNYNNRTNND